MKYFSIIFTHISINWSLYLTILALIILIPTILGCGGGDCLNIDCEDTEALDEKSYIPENPASGPSYNPNRII